MRNGDLGHILRSEPEIATSSGFAASVMGAISMEAATSPALAFPWKRALPGFLAALLLPFLILLGIIVLLARDGMVEPASTVSLSAFPWISDQCRITGGWIVLALLLSYVSAKLAMRYAAPQSSDPNEPSEGRRKAKKDGARRLRV